MFPDFGTYNTAHPAMVGFTPMHVLPSPTAWYITTVICRERYINIIPVGWSDFWERYTALYIIPPTIFFPFTYALIRTVDYNVESEIYLHPIDFSYKICEDPSTSKKLRDMLRVRLGIVMDEHKLGMNIVRYVLSLPNWVRFKFDEKDAEKILEDKAAG